MGLHPKDHDVWKQVLDQVEKAGMSLGKSTLSMEAVGAAMAGLGPSAEHLKAAIKDAVAKMAAVEKAHLLGLDGESMDQETLTALLKMKTMPDLAPPLVPPVSVSWALSYTDNPDITIYTDGSSYKDRGGAACVVEHKGDLFVACAHIKGSTHRAELFGAWMANWFVSQHLTPINLWKPRCYVDNQSVQKGFAEWYPMWAAQGGKLVNGNPVANWDLWQKATELGVWGQIGWEWVKGHSGVLGNELSDCLAGVARHLGTMLPEHTQVYVMTKEEIVPHVEAILETYGVRDHFGVVDTFHPQVGDAP